MDIRDRIEKIQAELDEIKKSVEKSYSEKIFNAIGDFCKNGKEPNVILISQDVEDSLFNECTFKKRVMPPSESTFKKRVMPPSESTFDGIPLYTVKDRFRFYRVL